jgi:hypothetical protein
MSNTAQAEFETFHLYTDQPLDSTFVKKWVEHMKVCLNMEQPKEETRQDRYLDEWAEGAVCLVHVNSTHRILLHCGVPPMYNRYRKKKD